MTTPPTPPPATPQQPSSGNRTLLIILGILLLFVLVMGGCVVACTYFVKSKAAEFGEYASDNPELAAIKFAASIAPNIEVSEEDEESGIVTLRNTDTGEEIEIDLNDFSSENIGEAFEDMMAKLEEQGASGQRSSREEVSIADYSEERTSRTAADTRTTQPELSPAKAAALAANVGRLPDFVTPYPNGTTQEASVHSFGPQMMGTYAFSTEDTPEAVVAFYEQSLEENGFTVVTSGFSANDYGTTATYIANADNGAKAFSLEAAPQADGKVHAQVSATVTER